jgi:hypothetical protein
MAGMVNPEVRIGGRAKLLANLASKISGASSQRSG